MANTAVKALKFESPTSGDDGPPTWIGVTPGHAVVHSYNEFCLVDIAGHGLCVVDLFDKSFMKLSKKTNDERTDKD